MNCLVVGAAGTIGSAVSSALEADGHRVVRIGGPFSVKGRAGFAYSEGIYTALQQELEAVELVVYAAGRVVPSTNVSANEALKLDANPLGELLESFSRTATRPAFVLISSAGAVYGPAPEHGVLTEDSPLAPLSVYGFVRTVMSRWWVTPSAPATCGASPCACRTCTGQVSG
jgi:nucleoside-diphosphate-sugar epimerase